VDSLSLADASGAELGLICGYQVFAHGRPKELHVQDLPLALAATDAVTWLHFNLSDLRVRRWLLATPHLPMLFREALQELEGNRRIEAVEDGVLLVLNDLGYQSSDDPDETGALWCYADSRRLITARVHALKSPDDFRQRLRLGAVTSSGIELLAQLLDLRSDRLRALARQMSAQLDRIEDEILAGNVKLQREYLGRTRRTCARLRRQFAPERIELAKFMRTRSRFSASDHEALAAMIDNLAFAIEELSELYERAKLLQEELASRLAESTSRNLYTLSVLTAVLLPMTLVTGVFGMNVAGLPGMRNASAFWHVMLLIFASGGLTLAALRWRKLL